MGTSGTESCEGCLLTQFKHLPPQLALRLSPVRLVYLYLSLSETILLVENDAT